MFRQDIANIQCLIIVMNGKFLYDRETYALSGGLDLLYTVNFLNIRTPKKLL